MKIVNQEMVLATTASILDYLMGKWVDLTGKMNDVPHKISINV